MKKMVMRAALLSSAAAALVFAGGIATVASAAPANTVGVESYVRYGTYGSLEECSAYGVAYRAAHPESSGWSCLLDGGNRYVLYVEDDITD